MKNPIICFWEKSTEIKFEYKDKMEYQLFQEVEIWGQQYIIKTISVDRDKNRVDVGLEKI